MKRWISVLTAVLLTLLLPVQTCAAEWPQETADEEPLPVAATVSEADELDLSAAGAALVELSTGRVLFEQNGDIKRPMASVTKIMSLLLVMEAIDRGQLSYETVLTCSETAAALGGSQIWLEPGEQMSVEELLKAVFVVSANDATVLLGEALAGSEEGFVVQMNRRAQELGLTGTHFVNATGLDEDDHYTTALDIAVMARALLSFPDVTRFSTVWMDSLRDGTSQLVNTNKLVRFYQGCTGLKTGTTSAAGSCLAASAVRDGVGLVAVVLGAPSSADRFADAQKMLNYGFARYTSVVLAPSLPAGLSASVERGVARQVAVDTAELPRAVLYKEEVGELRQEYELTEPLVAPVTAGQPVGTVRFYCQETCVGEVTLTAANDVKRLDFSFALRLLTACLLQT